MANIEKAKKDNVHRDKSVEPLKPIKGDKPTKNESKPVKNEKALLALKNIDVIKRDYDIQEETLTPNLILHKMSEILEIYLKTIQQILQPEEFHALYESNAFDEKDKAELFELYKRVIVAHRELLKAVIAADEKNSLSTIQFVHSEIQGVKGQMLEIVNRLQQSWKADAKKDRHKGTGQYFG
jgi:hypothetical protein